MKEVILKNWNFLRVIKLLFGLYLIFESITSKQYILLLLAAFFLYQSIFNVSPCGANGCNVPTNLKDNKEE